MLIRKKKQNPAVQHSELSSVLCDDKGGWDGRGMGWERGSREKGYMYTYDQFTQLYS